MTVRGDGGTGVATETPRGRHFRRRTSRRLARRLFFSAATTFAVLGALEGAVRVTHVVEDDRPISPLLFQNLPTVMGDFNPPVGPWVRFNHGQPIARKPPGDRILVFGESAVKGAQVTPFASFPARMERLLAHLRSERPVEVVNMGVYGVSSRIIVEILRKSLSEMHPQLVVFYVGNNEFHELRGLKYASPGYGRNREILRSQLHASHLYRLLIRGVRPLALEPYRQPDPVTMPLHRLPTTVDTDDRELANTFYKENLRAAISLARSVGVEVLLTTVADGRASFGQIPIEGAIPEPELNFAKYLQSIAHSGDGDELARLAHQARGDVHDERALRTIGRTLLDAGRLEEAKWWLDEAELVALRPCSSNIWMRESVRELAREENVALCDTAQILDAASDFGVSGSDQFEDICHPGPRGHNTLAEAILRCIAANELLDGFDESSLSRGLFESLDDDPYRVDHDARREKDPPFPHVTQGNPATVLAFEGHQRFSRRDYAAAAVSYEAALEAGGPPAALHASLAIAALWAEDFDRASVYMAKALADSPDDAELRHWAVTLPSTSER